MAWPKKEKIYHFLKNNLSSIILLTVIVILGNTLREFSYAEVPNPGETRDEYSFGWMGISLIKDKFPIAWSGIKAYGYNDYQKINVDHKFDKDEYLPLFPINKPWFDHPPAFGLLVGGYAYAKGIKSFQDASVIILRRPVLKLGILTTILVFILANLLFGKGVAILSSLLYSTVPTIVISSRLALAENGYTPLFLVCMIFAVLFFQTKKITYWYIASFICGFAILFKLSAVSILISLSVLSLYYGGKEKIKLLKSLFITFLVFVGLYFIYGAYFGWDQFIKVLFANAERYYGAGAEIIFSAFTKSKVTKNLTDGWILSAWISLFIFNFFQKKKDLGIKIISISLFSYLLVFIIFGSEAYGSYRIPFYPFLTIMLAQVIIGFIKSNQLLLLFLLLLLPFGTSLHRLIGVEGFQNYADLFRIFGLFTFFVYFINILIRNPFLKLLERALMYAMVFFVIWLSIKEIYFYTIE